MKKLLLLAALLVSANAIATPPPLKLYGGAAFGPNDNTAYSTAYGCKADGVTDDTTCLTNTIAAAVATHQTVGSNTTKGAIIKLPPGVYKFSTPLDMHAAKNIIIEGSTGYGQGFPQGGTVLMYTGTGATSAINVKSSQGVVFRDLAITYTSGSFTGALVDFSHDGITNFDATMNLIERCFLGSYDSTVWSAASLINMNDSVGIAIKDSTLAYAFIGILLRNTNVDYSNSHIIENNSFHDFQTGAIMNAYQRVTIRHNLFENNHIRTPPFMAPAYADNTTGGGSCFVGLDFSDNWIGDGDGSTYIFDTSTGCASGSNGLNMTGNFLAGKIRLYDLNGASITGNAFNSASAESIDFHAGGTYRGVNISQNSLISTMTVNNLPASGVTMVGNVSYNGTFDLTDSSPNYVLPTMVSGSTNLNWSALSGTLSTPTGTNTFNGDMRLLAGKTFDMPTASTMVIAGATASALNMGRSGIAVSIKGQMVYQGALAIAAASSITITPSVSIARITLSGTAITSLTVSAGVDGQILVVEVIEDATGTRTIPTTWTNVAFAGGTYVVTTTASKRDVITLVYNATLAKWVEQSRAVNI